MNSFRTITAVVICIGAVTMLVAAGVIVLDAGDPSAASNDQDDDSGFVASGVDTDDQPREATRARPVEPTSDGRDDVEQQDHDLGHRSPDGPADDTPPTVEPVDPTDELPADIDEQLDAPDEIASQPEESDPPHVGEHRESSDQPADDSGTDPDPNQPTGRLVVITNFGAAQVMINDEPYPAYSDDLRNRGIELVAGEPHEVLVQFGDDEQMYIVELHPGERRMLIAEPGIGGTDRRSRPGRDRGGDDDEDSSRLAVYSRPRGEIYIDGESTGERTPETIHVDPGRYEVHVEFQDGESSDTRHARVRPGSRVQLTFRGNDD